MLPISVTNFTKFISTLQGELASVKSNVQLNRSLHERTCIAYMCDIGLHVVDWKFSEPRNVLSYEVFCCSVLTWPLQVNSAWLPDWQLWATPVICINPRWPLPTFKFWDPLNISGTAKARNLKFGVRIDYDACYSKNAKLGDKMGVA